MAQPYVGEVRLFGGNFAPAGWMFCDGQLVPISEYETLFNLIGTTYGGDGEATFAMPDLRGRVPLHQGNGFIMGETGGAEQVTVTVTQLPAHTHGLLASRASGTLDSPVGAVPAVAPQLRPYTESTPNTALAPGSLAGAGGSQPHENMQPYLGVSFIISAFGIYPSPT